MYCVCPKIEIISFYYPLVCLKLAGSMADSVDTDQMLHFAASDLGLHSLLEPVCPNTSGKYSIAMTNSFVNKIMLL